MKKKKEPKDKKVSFAKNFRVAVVNFKRELLKKYGSTKDSK